MRRSRKAIFALAWAAFAASAVHADDKTARELVEQGLKAQGGETLLARLPAMTAKMKGTFHGMGEATDFTGDVAMQGADQSKVVIYAEAGGQRLRISHVFNRDKAWVQFDDQTEELEGEDLDEAKEEAYLEWVCSLVPVTGPKFTLSIVGEARIDDRPAMGITASSPGHRDVNLYFDKQSGLLVKTEKRVKDETNGQEVTEETFLSDYKPVQETRQAMKFVVKRDGKLYLEGELTDLELSEKLEDSLFAKP